MRIALVLLSSLYFLPSYAVADDARRSITTSGDAIVYVVPDEADVSLGIQSTASKLDDAKSANDKGATDLLAAVKACGVEEKQISTTDVTVTIDYDNYSHGSVNGYTVTRSYTIKMTDVKTVSKVIDAALHHGANQLGGVTFSSSQLRKYRDQARKMAAKAAREKAADLAVEFDAAVGSVHTVSENSGIMNYWAGSRFGNSMQNVAAGPGGGADGDETTPPGQISIRASVTATFDLTDQPARTAGQK